MKCSGGGCGYCVLVDGEIQFAAYEIENKVIAIDFYVVGHLVSAKERR